MLATHMNQKINTITHVVRCFRDDAVNATFNKTTSGAWDGSIFACFARLGQASVSISHTMDETRFAFCIFLLTSTNSLPSFRAHIARWCAESNQPMNLVKDCEFNHLMKAGHPGTSIPTLATVGHDIKICYSINLLVRMSG